MKENSPDVAHAQDLLRTNKSAEGIVEHLKEVGFSVRKASFYNEEIDKIQSHFIKDNLELVVSSNVSAYNESLYVVSVSFSYTEPNSISFSITADEYFEE